MIDAKRREDVCVVPGSQINLDEIFNSQLDAVDVSKRKDEQARVSSAFTAAAPHMMMVGPAKQEARRAAVRKWKAFAEKVNNSPANAERSVEHQLRILRAFRIRLLHEFVVDVQREFLPESLVAQSLMTARELRRHA